MSSADASGAYEAMVRAATAALIAEDITMFTPAHVRAKKALDAALAVSGTAHLQRRVRELEQTLSEVLARFTEQGHPGRACLRTGWQYVEQVEEWRDAIRPAAVAEGGAA